MSRPKQWREGHLGGRVLVTVVGYPFAELLAQSDRAVEVDGGEGIDTALVGACGGGACGDGHPQYHFPPP